MSHYESNSFSYFWYLLEIKDYCLTITRFPAAPHLLHLEYKVRTWDVVDIFSRNISSWQDMNLSIQGKQFAEKDHKTLGAHRLITQLRRCFSEVQNYEV